MKVRYLLVSFVVGLGLAVAVLGWLGGAARADATPVHYVASTGTDSGACTNPAQPCRTVQHAMDRAGDGDVIKVAQGTYTGVQRRSAPLGYIGSGVITQVVYIGKSVTLRGGYTAANWETADPAANPTVLDAQGLGRALFIAGDIGVTIEGLSITGGDATGLGGGPLLGENVGGGAYVAADRVALHDNRIFGNRVFSTTTDTVAYGGGLYLAERGTFTLDGNVVVSNTAGGHGGGLYLDKSVGLCSDNRFASNTAMRGGGLFLAGSGATLRRNTVVSNAADYGGGLLLWISDGAILNGNTVVSNTADYGGGLYLDRSATVLANHVVAGNRASVAGSGLYVLASSPRLLHTTIAHNGGGDGSGVYVTDDGKQNFSAVTLINTILGGHTVGIYVTAGNTATLEATLWGSDAWANDEDWGGAGLIIRDTRNEWWYDPDFVAGNYHISIASPALDKGVDAGVRDDVDGDPRPQGNGYDLGADETGLALTKRASPALVLPGAQLHYTIYVTNTSGVTLTATLTDSLPGHVTPGGILTWPLVTLPPGGIHMKTVVVTVAADYTGVLTNIVQATTDKGAGGTYVETSMAGYRPVYLPVVMRKH
jgi:uncharacterized repeat protein (TIGR01451 family)